MAHAARTRESKEPALPPMRDDMQLTKPEHILRLRPDSFKALNDSFEVRETDILRLTGGSLAARVFRTRKGGTHALPWHWHEWGFQIGYITKGWAVYEFEGVGVVKVEAGDFLFQPSNSRHRELNSSDDFEGVEITLPGNVRSFVLNYDEGTKQWNETEFVGEN